MTYDPFFDDADENYWDDADTICIVSVARRTINEELVDRIQALFGGTTIFVPSTMTEGHILARAIGLEAAQLLANEIGGVKCWVKRGVYRPDLVVREIVRWGRHAGITAFAIAELAEVSDRHVRHVTGQLRAAGELPPYVPPKARRRKRRHSKKERKTHGIRRPDLVVREVVRWGRHAGMTAPAIAWLTGASERHVRSVASKMSSAGELPPIDAKWLKAEARA